ncbi:sensor histidine kinase [Caldalkalibacillus mannanilyticus]|uniref:sensor histidine kinase n=1 Tax=Caldalkalibacillus mannanilyticus TaxID=1418 RepID=UPI000A7525A5|nr:sensor histidine kinase [Caldalkalibacillus mannanilyticus]
MDEEGVRQVGVVVVGVLTPTIQNVLYQFQYDILLSLVWGLVIGLLGSWLLANNIKKQMLGMEPYEISKLLEERSAVMQALDTGIVAVDDQGKISFMNRLAQEYAGIEQINISYEYSLHKLFPELWQFMIQNRGIETVNKTMLLKGKMYLTTIHPIYVKETFVGTVLILTNRTEANRLAEELTGVKNLVDALRAQNHEYMNKLHSIAGLIQLDRTEEALDKIIDETSDEQDVIQYFKDHISVYSISGLLLGKRSRAHELGVQLTIDRTSYLTDIIEGLHSGDLITLIGNVIENALEACIDSGENKQVTCIIQGNEHFFLIEVKDTGVGITESERVKMFDYGFSTKAKEGRGIGLALVKQIVDAQEGEMEVSSKIGEGTKIKILLGGETNEANQGFYYRR